MTSPDERDIVERLRELLARATQGEWQIQDGCSWRRIGTREGNGNVLCPSTYSNEDRHPDLTCGKGEDLYANLKLIVEAVNALPALLDLIEKHRAAVEELRGTLAGWHENQTGITEDEAIEKLVAVAEAARSLIAIGEAVKLG